MEYKLDNLKTAMRIKNIGVRDLAKIIDKSKSTAGDKINGESEFKLNEAKKVADFFDISLEIMFYSEEDIFLTHFVRKNDTKAIC
ncbi:helix-turn-helix domain-containing protein [Orenia marismortui]|uniref:BetR domain-containing protein n=1 Tax=Orenia marismortui TaxID=46469 RepID=A0A4R8GR44_9FIRM|nr:helix-turn-helix transcriptional regulator [Orenia marismortui]TDX48311.1 BetR domain-containing protein [Orenia marismortui]